jgi:hypothetical protein
MPQEVNNIPCNLSPCVKGVWIAVTSRPICIEYSPRPLRSVHRTVPTKTNRDYSCLAARYRMASIKSISSFKVGVVVPSPLLGLAILGVYKPLSAFKTRSNQPILAASALPLNSSAVVGRVRRVARYDIVEFVCNYAVCNVTRVSQRSCWWLASLLTRLLRWM